MNGISTYEGWLLIDDYWFQTTAWSHAARVEKHTVYDRAPFVMHLRSPPVQ